MNIVTFIKALRKCPKEAADLLYAKVYSSVWQGIKYASKFGIPLTKDRFKILMLKNRYKGGRCFIIGNGPSLIPEDLDRLKNEITFTSNKIYKIFSKTTWRPTFYMAIDGTVIEQNYIDINELKGFRKFTIRHYQDFLKADIYFDGPKDRRGCFSTNVMEAIYPRGSVSYQMLQIAYYMGFSEVYLIGHDHNYKDAISVATGESTARENRNTKMYFGDNYVSANERPAETAADEIVSGMEQARLAYEQSGRKIYNATRSTHLNVFEKVDFDELMKCHER